MTRFHVRTAGLLAALAVPAILFSADLPWVGKWKINLAASDFGETTTTYADLGSGEMQWTADGMSMKFKMDGKDYPDPLGGTSAWKQLDAATWETVNKLNGKVLNTDTTKLSADGKTLTIATRGTKPNGTPLDTVAVLSRVSGGPGLAGKWKTNQVTNNSPSLIEIAAFDTDGLAVRVPAFDSRWSAKFDGKDYPIEGPNVPAGITIALRRTGPRSYDFTRKHSGKELNKGSVAVSDDGKTTTVIGMAVGSNEKTKAVYDRQ